MSEGGQPTSPYVVTFGDYLYDPAFPDAHVIRITVNFDNTTRAITGATVYRSADCRWTKILVGVLNGSPDATDTKFDLTGFSGTRNFSANTLSKAPWNVDTIEQFLNAGQITAGL